MVTGQHLPPPFEVVSAGPRAPPQRLLASLLPASCAYGCRSRQAAGPLRPGSERCLQHHMPSFSTSHSCTRRLCSTYAHLVICSSSNVPIA